MSFKSAPIFEIVRLIDLQPRGQTSFCMLVTSSADPEFVDDLQEELDLQINGAFAVIDVAGLSAIALVEQLRKRDDAALLLYGFEAWDDDEFASMDVNRSRLETGAFLIFSVDLKTAARFLNRAPNIRSFLGTNIFVVSPDPSSMSASEIADRLNQLRTFYGLSDADVIDRAAARVLPPEPHFAEWLVLLGRSELVR